MPVNALACQCSGRDAPFVLWCLLACPSSAPGFNAAMLAPLPALAPSPSSASNRASFTPSESSFPRDSASRPTRLCARCASLCQSRVHTAACNTSAAGLYALERRCRSVPQGEFDAAHTSCAVQPTVLIQCARATQNRTCSLKPFARRLLQRRIALTERAHRHEDALHIAHHG